MIVKFTLQNFDVRAQAVKIGHCVCQIFRRRLSALYQKNHRLTEGNDKCLSVEKDMQSK